MNRSAWMCKRNRERDRETEREKDCASDSYFLKSSRPTGFYISMKIGFLAPKN